MSKKLINQNSNYNLEFLEAVESNFTFEEKPINRLKTDTVSPKTENTEKNIDKNKLLNDLKIEISTIEECELKNNSSNSNLYLYLGISQMELNQFEESQKTLNSLINSNLIDSEKGYWFKGLLYLKSNRINKAKIMLQKIIDNSYYSHLKASEILIKLNKF